MKNGVLFIISAAISLHLLLFVNSQRNNSQRVLVMPVEIQNLPRDKVILLPTLRQIEVTIQGPEFIVTKAAAGAHSVKVDLPAHVGDRFSREWSSFDPVQAGEVLGHRDDGQPVVAETTGWIVLPNPRAQVGQEWFYLARASDRPL